MSIDVMKQALEALEECIGYKTSPFMTRECEAAITALRTAIEQAQEPVAWVSPKWLNPKTRHWTNDTILHKPIAGWIPLYTAPRQWQGLTEKEAMEAVRVFRQENEGGFLVDFARAIEAKLREKNT